MVLPAIVSTRIYTETDENSPSQSLSSSVELFVRGPGGYCNVFSNPWEVEVVADFLLGRAVVISSLAGSNVMLPTATSEP